MADTEAEALISQFNHKKVGPIPSTPTSPPPYEETSHEPGSESGSGDTTPTPTPAIAPVAESLHLPEHLHPSPHSPANSEQGSGATFGDVPSLAPAAGTSSPPSTPGASRRARGDLKRIGHGIGKGWSSPGHLPQLTIQTSVEYFQQQQPLPIYKQHPPSAPPMLMEGPPANSSAMSPPMSSGIPYALLPGTQYPRAGSMPPPGALITMSTASPPPVSIPAGYQMVPQGYMAAGMGVSQGGMYYTAVPHLPVCRYFQQNRCWAGQNCRFSHVIGPGPYIAAYPTSNGGTAFSTHRYPNSNPSPNNRVVQCRYFLAGRCW
ncbi:hypothetical protein HDV00_010422 [Rhizophlyctis rosea]|nr:hypothetical protein HDV00_010422 [Rhizophlyctis rosea]